MKVKYSHDVAQSVLGQIFKISTAVRYAALYQSGKLMSQQRTEAANTPSSESDHYEELFINPAILTLVKQRGNIDCGGAKFVVVRYGHFYQLVIDLPGGHVSVCFELNENPIAHAEAITSLCTFAL